MHPVLGLCDRNAWANREVRRQCASLDPSLLQRAAPGTYGTIAQTLTHIVRGDQSYVRRLTGLQPSESADEEGAPALDRLEALAAECDGRMRGVLAAGPDPQRLRAGVADWVVLVEHVQHGDDHRAHIGTVLGTAGIEPVSVSSRAYLDTGPTPPVGVVAGPWADVLLARFLGHSGWATHLLLEHCLDLGDEALTATADGTYGTVQETLTHLLDADVDYLDWLTGRANVALEGAAAPEVLREWEARSRAGWRAHLESGPDHERVAVRTDGRPAPAWLLVVQAVHHANEHRAHVSTILGARGLEVPGTDTWHYGWAEGAVAPE